VNAADPGFFERSAKGQTPKVRCSLPNLKLAFIAVTSPFALVSTHAGALARMFLVHRNIAK
jgi:hypothetical protein